MSAQIFFYAPKARAHEFIELGWESHNSLEGTYHGQFSILMEWKHDGSPKIPDDLAGAKSDSRKREGTT